MFETQGPWARVTRGTGWRSRLPVESHPVPTDRYRCAACGNLTRFDVTTTRRTRAYHHYTVGGDLVVEAEDVLDERVEEVSCRWCGHGTAVEALEE